METPEELSGPYGPGFSLGRLRFPYRKTAVINESALLQREVARNYPTYRAIADLWDQLVCYTKSLLEALLLSLAFLQKV